MKRFTVLRALGLALLLATGWGECHGFSAVDRWVNGAYGPTGGRGDPVVLTWSLPADGTAIRNQPPSTLVADLDAAFGVAPVGAIEDRPWFAALEAAFERWSAVGGVTFRYEPADDGAEVASTPGLLGLRGDVRLSAAPLDGPDRTLAVSQFPDTGDVIFDSSDLAQLASGVSSWGLRNVLMHELGHTLGLGHVETTGEALLLSPRLERSIDGPQLDDLRGLHRLYGDRLEAAGNDSLAAPSDLGVLPAGGNVRLGADSDVVGQRVEASSSDFLSIDGLSDADFFRFELADAALVTLSLTPYGGVLTQSVEGQPSVVVDARRQNNLNLRLFDGSGALLASANGSPRGTTETIAMTLGKGLHSIEVYGVNDAVQLYSLRVETLAVGVPEPTAVTLAWTLGAVALIFNARFLGSTPGLRAIFTWGR